MGLDITAYSKLTPITPELKDGEPTAANYWETMVEVYLNPDFPGRELPLVAGWYGFSDRVDFRAGSYGGYNRWRDWLAQIAGYPATPFALYGSTTQRHDAGAWATDSGPFWELINFSDAEGVIGSAVATKLAKDFAEWDARAKAASESAGDPWLYEAFANWRRAVELAADGGGVRFH